MSEYLYAFASFGFLLWIARNAFFWGQLLQKNAYSLRAIKRYLTETTEGRKTLFSPLSLLKWIAILSYPFIIFYENYEIFYHFFITLIYISEIVVVVREMIHDKFLTQKLFTFKSFLIICVTLVIGIILFLFPPLDKFLWLVVVDRFIVFLMFFLLLIASIPEEFYWEYREAGAKEKLRSHNSVRGIFIFGGEEARVIKQLLFHALEKVTTPFMTPDYADEKTIIDSIVKKFLPTHTVILSDFQKGENEIIKSLLSLRTPVYLIISSISGIKENITGKIGGHKSPASAIFINADNLTTKKLITRKKNVQYYSVGSKKEMSLTIESIILEKDQTRCRVRYHESTISVQTAYISTLSIPLVLPVIGVLLEIGMKPDAISKEIASHKISDTYLHFTKQKSIAYVHHSSETNPTNIVHLLSYIGLYKNTKVLILDTELFSDRSNTEEYFRIGKEISKHFDYIFLISSPLEKYIIPGIRAGSEECTLTIDTSEMISEYLSALLHKNDVALFFGARAADIYRTVTQQNPAEESIRL